MRRACRPNAWPWPVEKVDKLDQQLDQAQTELQSANQRLSVVNSQVSRFTTQFDAMRSQIGRIAAQAYMQGQVNSSIELLTTGKPQQILDESSILSELSSSNSAQVDQFVAAAQRLIPALAEILTHP